MPEVLFGLRLGDCEGHLRTVDALASSRNQFDNWMAVIRGLRYVRHHCTAIMMGLSTFNLNVVKHTALHHHQQQSEQLIHSRMDPNFQVFALF